MTPVLLTVDRLALREFAQDDWQAVHEYAADPEVVRYMTWGPNDEEQTRGFIRRGMAGQEEFPRRKYELAIVLQAETRLIGGCGIVVSDPDDNGGWIGYCFNRRYWGQGYATEAATALLAFGFAQLGLHRIWATCDPANLASAHVLEKSGMQREGHLREHKWEKGRWRDSLLYAVLEHEWRGRREATGGSLWPR